MSGVGSRLELNAVNTKAATLVNNSSGATASGTIQVAAAGYGARHYFVCSAATYHYQGTGTGLAAPSASTGGYWPADTPFEFTPVKGNESIAWATVSAANAVFSVFCVSRDAVA